MTYHRTYSDPAALLAAAKARKSNDGWPIRRLTEHQQVANVLPIRSKSA